MTTGITYRLHPNGNVAKINRRDNPQTVEAFEHQSPNLYHMPLPFWWNDMGITILAIEDVNLPEPPKPPAEDPPDFTTEPCGIQPGDTVKIVNIWHAQGYLEPDEAIGKRMTVRGVNYDQHWIYGNVEDGGEIGLTTFGVAK